MGRLWKKLLENMWESVRKKSGKSCAKVLGEGRTVKKNELCTGFWDDMRIVLTTGFVSVVGEFSTISTEPITITTNNLIERR